MISGPLRDSCGPRDRSFYAGDRGTVCSTLGEDPWDRVRTKALVVHGHPCPHKKTDRAFDCRSRTEAIIETKLRAPFSRSFRSSSSPLQKLEARENTLDQM